MLAASGVSWSAIVVAVLGSSALGAIVGGMITTRMRGRIERDEAWRTRLVDASEAFLLQLDRTTGAIPCGWLVGVESDERPLRSNGQLTAEAQRALTAFEAEKANLLPLRARIELLFGADIVRPARSAVRNLDSVAALLVGDPWIAAEIAEHGAVRLEVSRYQPDPGIPAPTPPDPEEFDPEDDASVAEWARLLHESVDGHRKQFVKACVSRINSDRPSRLDRHSG
jgi:hypothetical protein